MFDEKNLKQNSFNIITILEYLLAISLIFDIYSVFLRIPGSISKLGDHAFGLFSLILIFLLIILTKIEIPLKYYFYIGLICLYLMGYYFSFFGQHTSEYFFGVFFPFVLLVFLQIKKNFENDSLFLMKKLINITTIIAGVSLIVWFFGPLTKIIQPTGTTILDWNSNYRVISKYFGIYYQTQFYSLFSTSLPRNTAIFSEAPMYSFVLVVIFLISYFFINGNRNKNIILGLATISTFSTTGMISIISAVFLKFLYTNLKNFYNNRISFVWFLSFLSLPIIFYYIYSSFKSWLNQKNIYNNSIDARSLSISSHFQAFKENIFLGIGYNNFDNILGNSTGLLRMMAQGGLYLSLPILIYIILYLYNTKNKYNFFIFISIFLVNYLFTNVAFNILPMYIFVFIISNVITIKKNEVNLYNEIN